MVAMDDVEFDLAGDEGRWEISGGDGAVRELAEFR